MKTMSLELKKILFLFVAIGLFAACSSDHEGLAPADNGEWVPLQIAAGINVQATPVTRAVETSWEANDQIGVYIKVHATGVIFEDNVDEDNRTRGENLKYTFNDGTNYETWGTTYRLFSPEKKIYIASEPVDVYGYYPYVSTGNPIDINVLDQTSQKTIDFMRAKTGNVTNGNASIELLFKHKLVKLVFNLKQGEGLLPDELKDATYLGMKIRDQRYKATYDIYKEDDNNPNPLDPTTNIADIIPVKASQTPTGYVRTFEAIVLPNVVGTNPAANRTVEISFYRRSDDVITNTFTIPKETSFKPGYKYVYNVTVNALSVTVDTQRYTEQW